VIEGLRRLPLARHDDERGWLGELARASALPKPIRQVNLAFSRRGVLRGLHCEDIGDENPVAIYVPGHHPNGYEALTDALFGYLLTEEYDAADPDEHGVPWNDPRVKQLWSTEAPIVSARDTP
jgi:dTDP-4-dehydrorhamnose 3,5-epimerase-like enzyme